MRTAIRSILCVGLWAALVPLPLGCREEPEKRPATRSSTEPAAGSPEHYEIKTGTVPIVFAPAPQSPRPKGRLPDNASCVTPQCHAALTQAAQIHGPVAQRACDSCHAGDTGDHHFPLKRDPVATCTFCHAVTGTQAHQHKALEKGCSACHRAHTSNAKFLLNADSVGQLCTNCHKMPIERFAHEAAAKGQCTACHWPHQSATAKLLRGGDGNANCLSCHQKMSNALATAAHVHKPATQDCKACHEPHSGKFAHLLRSNVDDNCLKCHDKIREHLKTAAFKHSAMDTANGCANCHDAHTSENKKLLRDRMDRLCLTCHDKPLQTPDGRTLPNMKSVLTESKFLHGPIRMASCSGCHDPHGGKFPFLLDANFPREFYSSFDVRKYELCFKCHKSDMVLDARTTTLTGFRDGNRNLHFVHVNRDEKGRTCRTCHSVHGSNLPRHMAGEVPFEGGKWSMPIEFEQSANGGRCAPGCHNPMAYDRTKPPSPTQPGIEPSATDVQATTRNTQ